MIGLLLVLCWLIALADAAGVAVTFIHHQIFSAVVFLLCGIFHTLIFCGVVRQVALEFKREDEREDKK